MIAAVVLAAGLSRRMGEPKLLLPLDGVPVIRATVERVRSSGVDAVLVVAGAEHEAVRAALAGLPVEIVVNPHPETGQASSVRTGIAALSPGVDAALIALGDQPFLPPEVIPALLAERRRSGKPIAAPRYRDGRGNPVLFDRAVFPELLQVSGDQGARSVVERDPERVALAPFDFPMPADLDTPEDYRRLRAPSNPL